MALLGLFGDGEDDSEIEFDGNDRFDFTLSEEKNVKLTKDIDEPSDVDVRYPLIRPFAEAHVKWDDNEKTLRYHLEEPGLDNHEQQVMQKIKDNLSEKIDVSLSSIQSREKIIAYLEKKIDELLLELGIQLEDESEDRVLYYIYRDYVGLGKVEPLMHDPYIEDIGCLAEKERIFVRSGGETIQVEAGELAERYLPEGNGTERCSTGELELLSFDEDGEVDFRPVSEVMRRKNYSGNCYEITTTGNNSIEVSPDHPVLVLTESGVEEKRAEDISEEDYLLRLDELNPELETETEIDVIEGIARTGRDDWRVHGAAGLVESNMEAAELLGVSNRKVANWKCRDSMPIWAFRALEEQKNPENIRMQVEVSPGRGSYRRLPGIIDISPDMAKLIGYFLAEGFYDSTGIGFAFHSNETEYHREVKQILEGELDLTVSMRDRKRFDTKHIHCGGRIIEVLFRDVLELGTDCYDKSLPNMAYTWNESMLKHLMKGYVNGEGYARITEDTKKAILPTASRDLANGVRYALFRLGYRTAIDKRSREYANTWEVRVEGGDQLAKYVDVFDPDARTQPYETRPSNSELYPHFIVDGDELSGQERDYFRRARKQGGRISKSVISEADQELIQKDFHPVPVVNVEEKTYERPFYDFKMEGEPNFMHGDFIFTHNCDGVGTPIFAVHSEFGSVKTDVVYEDEERLENVVIKLAERAGKYVSYADPLLDGALPDGSRVNASLTEEVTSKGPTFSIRKFQDTPFSAVDMMDLGTADAGVMAYMWIMEQYNQSFLVVGGTSTGKTSFLNSVVSFIPPEEKVVSIEDTRELRLPLENWIPSVTREMISGSSATDVDMDQLLKESFRQNPDYVIVGEVRGEEASVLFQGLSSGHPGAGTMHASSPGAVVKRLITPPISLSPALVEALDALVVMTHAKGVENSARRVKAVHELQKVVGSGSARTNEAFSWTARTDSFNKRGDPKLFDQISEDYGVPKDELKEEFEQRKQVLQWLQDKEVTEFDRVADVIASYYKDREKVLKMVNSGEASLDDVVKAEQEVGVSRPNLLDNSTEESDAAPETDSIPLKDAQNGSSQGSGGQEGDNPVAELQRRIRELDEKVDGEVEDNPFESRQKPEEDPFEA